MNYGVHTLSMKNEIVARMAKVFPDIYEISIESDQNRIMIAMVGQPGAGCAACRPPADRAAVTARWPALARWLQPAAAARCGADVFARVEKTRVLAQGGKPLAVWWAPKAKGRGESDVDLSD